MSFKYFKSHKSIALNILVISIFTIVTVGIIKQIVRYENETIRSSLEVILNTTDEALDNWKAEQLATVRVWSEYEELKKVVPELLEVSKSELVDHPLQQKIRSHLLPILNIYEYKGYFIVGRDCLNRSSSRDSNIGVVNLLKSQASFFEKIWNGKTILSTPIKSEVELHSVFNVSLFSGAPIRNKAGNIIAALCFRIDMSKTFTKILKRGRIGESGETYAINKDGWLISESRFTDQLKHLKMLAHDASEILNIKISDPGIDLTKYDNPRVVKNLPLTFMANEVLNAPDKDQIKTNLDGYRDYRGVIVLGSYFWDEDLEIGVTTEIDKKEAFSKFGKIKTVVLCLLLTLCIMFLVILYFYQRYASELHNIVDGKTQELSVEKEKLESESIQNARYAQEIQLQNFALNQHSAVSITDADGKIVYVNDVFLKQTQYSREEWIGQTHRMESTGIQDDVFFKNLWETVSAGKVWTGEIANKAKDGTVYWVFSTIVAYRDKEGKVVNYVSIRSDITEKKNIQNEMEIATKKVEELAQIKTRFLANMSHEIRTPMNGVLGVLTLLEDTQVTQDQDQWLKIIRECSNSMMVILNDILDLSKVEAGKLDLNIVPFDLSECIFYSVSLFSQKAKAKGLNIEYNISDDILGTYLGDSNRVSQVLINLLSNAVKFTEQGKVVLNTSVRSQDNNQNELYFEVIDQGIGIDKADQDKLFNAYAQVDESIAKKYGGTGLGLAICKNLVELMNGTIWIESEINNGSKFCFTIELEKSDVTVVEVNESKSLFDESLATQLPLKILVAEDNRVNQKVIQQFLLKLGYTIDIAEDGVEAIEFLKIKQYDLILMDLQMPRMDGVETTKNIIENYGPMRPRIIAMTANVQKEDQDSYLKVGMDDFVAKPIILNDLISALKRVDSSVTPKSTIEIKSVSEVYFNKDKIQEQYGDIIEVFSEIVEIFNDDYLQYIDAIAIAISSKDSKSLKSSSHAVKGALANLYLEKAANIAFELETLGTNQSFDGAQDQVVLLKDTIEASIAELNNYLSQP
ncbi:MAG: response regulator [Candidatus Cloacimonetes bacterium]|nr:response regulator [Candidatus Cloacimonadota bacterium]